MKNRNTLDPTIPPPPLVGSDDPIGREHYSPAILNIPVILIPYTPKFYKNFKNLLSNGRQGVYWWGDDVESAARQPDRVW
jgi:hypothetical protein